MSTSIVPIGLQSCIQTLNLTTLPQPLYEGLFIPGRYMLIFIQNGVTVLGGIDFIFDIINLTLIEKYKFVNVTKGSTPFNLGLSDNTIYIDYDNTNVTIRCETNTLDNVTCKAFIIPMDSSGQNTYSVNTITENTPGNGITFSNIINSISGMNINGPINLGTNDASDEIKVGTVGNRTISVGSTNSTTNINGNIETPNIITGSITFNDILNTISWTPISSSARRIGKIVYISAKVTLSSLDNLSKGIKYDLCTVTPYINFTSTTPVISSAIVDDGIIKTANIINDTDGKFWIVFNDDIATLSTRTISFGFSYIVD